MTDAEQANPPEPADPVQAALERLLSSNPEPTPDPEDEPTPETPAVEEAEEETPAAEPSAEVEGAVIETTPEKPQAVERQAPKPAPETAQKPSEPNPQDQLLAQLNSLVPQLQAQIAGEFADIKSFDDLQKVAAEDPQRYNRYVIHQAQLQHAQGEQQRLAGAAYQRFLQAQYAELQVKLPDYVDPVKGQALRAKFTEFARKQGYDEPRMRAATAADILTLHKAMQWEDYQAALAAKPVEMAAAQAKAKEKAAKAPPVQKPGPPQTNEKEDRAKEKLLKFQKSGHTDDLAALLSDVGLA